MPRFISAEEILMPEGFRKGVVLVLNETGCITDVLWNAYHEQLSDKHIEHYRGKLIPGLINAHCHTELSHLKDKIEPSTGLCLFIKELQKIRNQPEEIIRNACEASLIFMKEKGIVGVGDICNGVTAANVKTQSGIGWYNFIELFSFLSENASRAWNSGHTLRETFNQITMPDDQVSITPHAPYSVSGTLLDIINRNAGEGESVSIHMMESAAEREMFYNGTGPLMDMLHHFNIPLKGWKIPAQSSYAFILNHLIQFERKIFVHNTYALEEDAELMLKKSQGLFLCLCPGANLFIENRLPDVPLLVQTGAKICVGTDSLASNHTLDILHELSLIQNAFPFSTETLLQWATINGAEALGMKNKGSFEKGKSPGLNVLEKLPDAPDLISSYHLMVINGS